MSWGCEHAAGCVSCQLKEGLAWRQLGKLTHLVATGQETGGMDRMAEDKDKYL
jgi:hypothetical protein